MCSVLPGQILLVLLLQLGCRRIHVKIRLSHMIKPLNFGTGYGATIYFDKLLLVAIVWHVERHGHVYAMSE